MSVNPTHNKGKDSNIRIDYVSLFRFWKRLTPYQKEILAFGKSSHYPHEYDVKPESVEKVKEKLTEGQKELVGTKFFSVLESNHYSRATNRKLMLALQDQLELGLIKSATDFEFDISSGGIPTGRPPSEVVRKKQGIKKFKVHHGGETHLYDIFDVPEEVSNCRTWKLVQTHQTVRCFYTGEECLISDKAIDWRLTEEHLIPQVAGGKRGRGNNIVAANWINNILGSAPIHAKVDVKRALDKIICHPKTTMPERKKIYEAVTKSVLDQYKIYDIFPWNSIPKKFEDKAKKVKKVRKLHRQAEKKFIDDRLGGSHNIARTLKEITDGMEQAYYESL